MLCEKSDMNTYVLLNELVISKKRANEPDIKSGQ
jgi:hypothetical protein